MEDYKICGIVAAAGLLTAEEEKIFKFLLILDTVRGEDSTGIAGVSVNGDVLVSKVVGTPYDLFPMKLTERVFTANNRLLIGHNRYATQGGVTKKNAHPFEFDNVVGVHNGTLKARYGLKHNNYAVDSEQLYANIDEDGEKVVIPNVEGAYALVWYDKENEQLKVIRNKERPLHYAFSACGKKVFFASEAWMLGVALNRNNYKHRPIQEIQEDQLYTFDVGVNINFNNFNDVTFEKEELKQAPPKHVTATTFRPSAVGTVGTKEASGVNYIGTWVKGRFSPYVIHESAGGNVKYLSGYDTVLKINFKMYHTDIHVLEKLKGQAIEGKIMGVMRDTPVYILNPSSVITEQEAADQALADEMAEATIILEDKVVVDHMNRVIDEATFYKRYGECSNCGQNILYGDPYRPTDYQSCLCEDCIPQYKTA